MLCVSKYKHMKTPLGPKVKQHPAGVLGLEGGGGGVREWGVGVLEGGVSVLLVSVCDDLQGQECHAHIILGGPGHQLGTVDGKPAYHSKS